MGVYAVLVDEAGQERMALPDPSGGTFDAAGDFDRLLDQGNRLPVWSSIDPYGDVRFGSERMTELLAELDLLLVLARPGAETRGLLRLMTLARLCQDDGRLSLVLCGD